jgi:hypothetical protein
VIVIAPLFVVKVNWPCTEAGSANSNTRYATEVAFVRTFVFIRAF